MSYSAVPNGYDSHDISPPPPSFPSQDQTQYDHTRYDNTQHTSEKPQHLISQHSYDGRSDSEANKPFTSSHSKRPQGAWKKIKFAVIQIVSFLWIAPIVALLYFNFTQWIIGASAWCPFGHCRPYHYGGGLDSLTLLAEFDHDTHNLLGALQFVAKALEVWFVLVATAFVFRVTMIMVHMPDGLPIGYLFRPSEYAEVTSLIDPELYTTVMRMEQGGRKHTKKKVAAFLVLTILLCIICNLMGPAIAVLLIPQLQWIDSDRTGNNTLDGLNSASPPMLDNFVRMLAYDCSNESFVSQEYSCASVFPNLVDGWVQSYQSSQNSYTSIFSVQDTLTISYNQTFPQYDDGTHETMYFVPSRAVVQLLSQDSTILSYIDWDVTGADVDGTYTPYTRTVQSFVHRLGPMLGAIVNLFVDFDHQNHWTTTVGPDQYLKCYASYNMSNVPLCWQHSECPSVNYGNYTRCIQIGAGWNEDDNKNASFSITPPYNQDQQANDAYSLNGTYGPVMDVNIWSSAKVAFLPNGTLPSGFSEECLPRNGNISLGTKCDWDAFFATGDDPLVSMHSKQVTTWEIITEPQNSTDGASTTMLAVDFSVWQALADYSYDPSPDTNPMSSVDTSFILEKDEWFPSNISVLAVDPAWSLVSFGVNRGGIVTNDRPVAIWLANYISLLNDKYQEKNPFDSVATGIDGPTLMPVVQLMSMIDFNLTEVDTSKAKDDPAHPLLSRWAHMSVWAYSTDSRTAKFGIAVVFLGCLVILAKVIVALARPDEFPSPLKLLIAAMEHRYTGEFAGVKEKDYPTRTFKLHPDESVAGGFKFGKSF